MLIQEEEKEQNGNIILKKPNLLSDKEKKATPGEAKLQKAKIGGQRLGPIEEEKDGAESFSSDEFVRIERDYRNHVQNDHVQSD